MAEEQRKVMPIEVAAQLPRIERLAAYLLQGYELLEEDEAYFNTVSAAYRIIHNCEHIEEARRKITRLYPDLQEDLAQLVNDVQYLYGDFFEINKTVMRRIQERKYDYLYQRAIATDQLAVAQKCLSAIDKLYRLQDKESQSIKLPDQLPEVQLNSDPETFAAQKEYLDVPSE